MIPTFKFLNSETIEGHLSVLNRIALACKIPKYEITTHLKAFSKETIISDRLFYLISPKQVKSNIVLRC